MMGNDRVLDRHNGRERASERFNLKNRLASRVATLPLAPALDFVQTGLNQLHG